MALAYATDLATGHSRDFALRSCVVAMRMADAAGLDEPMRRAVYHQALLRYICENGFEHHVAANFSSVARVVHEAAARYLGWDVHFHEA